MPDQVICSTKGCDSPRLARGMCSRHYAAWRKQNPAAVGRYERQPEACSVDDCDRQPKARGMCELHYKRVMIHGVPEPRFRGEVKDGRRVCPRCEVDRPLAEWGAAAWCKACNVAHARSYYKPPATEAATCAHCGEGFQANKKRSVFCSTECTVAGKHRRNIKHVQARRARERGATVEDFRPEDIYERDGWVCRLCDEPIDQTAVKPHPRSRSIDHIVPISLGGEHSRANTQAAHLGCNVRKGARLEGQAV